MLVGLGELMDFCEGALQRHGGELNASYWIERREVSAVENIGLNLQHRISLLWIHGKFTRIEDLRFVLCINGPLATCTAV